MPVVSDEIDLCVECGFCEPICPSKEITMTPRQRIAVQREIKLGNANPSVLKDYNYDGIDTCATDGLCEISCPVNINTGTYIKSLKHEDLSFINNAGMPPVFSFGLEGIFEYSESKTSNIISFLDIFEISISS